MLVAYFLEYLKTVSASCRSWRPALAATLLLATALATLPACAGPPALGPNPAADTGTGTGPGTVTELEAVTPAPDNPANPARRPQTEPGAAPALSVDRIAYIGPYGDLFTVNPDGSDERRLTGVSRVRSRPTDPAGPASPSESEAAANFYTVQDLDFNESYAWPTWSPDGSRLAVSRVQITANRSLEVSVQVIDARTGVSRIVYENDVPALVADGAPHYLYWSPDGQVLTFLATTRQGLTLFAVNPDNVEGAVALERGAPLYFNWAGDGQSLIIHSREEVKLLQRPFRPDAALNLADSTVFRTPALSPDGRRWAVSAADVAGHGLYVGESDSPDAPARILDVGPLTAFMWSPDGQTLAVADNPDPQGRIFQRIRLVVPDGGNPRTLVDEPLLAFYWSPNGERMAWVGVDPEEQVFELKAASVKEGDGPVAGRELFRFRPSGEVFTMLSFFDQYAYSHSPWSPDSARLVIAGTQGPIAERRNGHTPSGARVYVIDAAGDAPPQEIAQGGVAFWSWN